MRKLLVLVAIAAALAVTVSPTASAHHRRRATPPNVVGLKLPVASERLRAAGWVPRPFNTDTLLGIVIPSHYTVCHEYKPIGRKVRILAQKYGCG